MNKTQGFMLMMFSFLIVGCVLFALAYLETPISQDRLNMIANAGIMVTTVSGVFLVYLFQKEE